MLGVALTQGPGHRWVRWVPERWFRSQGKTVTPVWRGVADMFVSFVSFQKQFSMNTEGGMDVVLTATAQPCNRASQNLNVPPGKPSLYPRVRLAYARRLSWARVSKGSPRVPRVCPQSRRDLANPTASPSPPGNSKSGRALRINSSVLSETVQ